MYRSAKRRSRWNITGRQKRILAVVGTLAVFGGIITVTQVSSAEGERRASSKGCQPAPGSAAPNGQSVTITQQNGRTVRNYWGDGQDCQTTALAAAAGAGTGTGTQTITCPSVADRLPQNIPAAARAEVDRNLAQLETQIAEANQRLATSQGQGGPNFVQNAILGPLASKRAAAIDRIAIAIDRVGDRPQGLESLATCTLSAGGNNNGGNNNGGNNNGGNNNQPPPLDFGPDECSEGNNLQPHDGFQNGQRCVDTQMGEVANADDNPSLLITSAPREVRRNQPFTIRVSTRNLIRDRFLPAGQGGYYVDMSILNEQNLVRGHFHSACRQLGNTNAAPDPEPAPAFFVATEDNSGGAQPDTIEIRVPGLANRGTFQCASWAGDASHRIPMMQRANQIPAFDAVRINVR